MKKTKMIGIVVPLLNNFNGFADLMLSVKTSHNYRVYLQPQYRAQVPLAAAWNRGALDAFSDGCDYALVCNDDIMFAPDTIDAMVTEYERLHSEGVIMVTPNNILGEIGDPHHILDYHLPAETVITYSEHPNFSCFLITKEYFDTIGSFDENFAPAWYEDNDSHRRAKLLGLKEICTIAAPMAHIGGVTTRQMANPDSGASQAYYIRKWGGIPESHPLSAQKEHFATPYNDSNLTPKDWELGR